MAFLSKLNPVPQFPAYKGPYNVASFDIEVPVAALNDSAQKPPQAASTISTVQFRVFYPTSLKEHVPYLNQTSTEEETKVEDQNEAVEKEAEVGGGGYHHHTWGSNWFKRHCHPERSEPQKAVYWLPEPHQREYLSGYARFLGAGSGLAELISYIPRILHHIAIPAVANEPLLKKPDGKKFPTMIFSHGLGGTRLAYSHICGSIASNGVVVIAPEHRDGSCPVTFIKNPAKDSTTELANSKPKDGELGLDASSATAAAKPGERVQVDYTALDHQISQETADGRNRQLEIRLWELSMTYSAVTKLDRGKMPGSAAMLDMDTVKRDALLSQFQNKLDIRQPGRLIWAGHSFGSSTTIQLLKSVYYADKLPPPTDETQPLYIPETSLPHDSNSSECLSLGEQITPDSPALLMDIWCLPTLSKRTNKLFKLPLPQIGGGNPRKVLVIMSGEFFRWRENLRCAKRIISFDPGRRRGTEEHKNFELWDDEEAPEDHKFHPKHDVQTPTVPTSHENKQLGHQIVPPPPTSSSTPVPPDGHGDVTEPRMFYVKDSAHLSQSDFGILFPRAVRKAIGHEEILDINVRAVCQWLRESGYAGQIAPYVKQQEENIDATMDEKMENMSLQLDGNDPDIFEGNVERWVRISVEE